MSVVHGHQAIWTSTRSEGWSTINLSRKKEEAKHYGKFFGIYKRQQEVGLVISVKFTFATYDNTSAEILENDLFEWK